jgi:hypothetical protein
MLKKIIKWFFLILLISIVGLALYGWYYATLIEERFSMRR